MASLLDAVAGNQRGNGDELPFAAQFYDATFQNQGRGKRADDAPTSSERARPITHIISGPKGELGKGDELPFAGRFYDAAAQD